MSRLNPFTWLTAAARALGRWFGSREPARDTPAMHAAVERLLVEGYVVGAAYGNPGHVHVWVTDNGCTYPADCRVVTDALSDAGWSHVTTHHARGPA